MSVSHLEFLKQTMASGKTAIGCTIQSPDATLSELAASAGFDFIWIDMEHAVNTPATVLEHIRAVSHTHCAPFVRVPVNEPWVVKTIIDFAPAGIIFPMVNTPEDACRAVAGCRYPMDGGERGIGIRRATGYGARPFEDYFAESRGGDPMVIIQIEDRRAVENLDAILAVPGWDSACIGPCDLSAAYGHPMSFQHPEVRGAIATIFKKVTSAGRMLGGFFPEVCLPLPPEHLSWRSILDDYGSISALWREKLRKAKE